MSCRSSRHASEHYVALCLAHLCSLQFFRQVLVRQQQHLGPATAATSSTGVCSPVSTPLGPFVMSIAPGNCNSLFAGQ